MNFISYINKINLYGFVRQKPRITENATFVSVSTKCYEPYVIRLIQKAVEMRINSCDFQLNRKEQGYKTNLHTLMIKHDENLRERGRMDCGTGFLIHGFLETRSIRTIDGKLRSTYFIGPRQMVQHWQ